VKTRNRMPPYHYKTSATEIETATETCFSCLHYTGISPLCFRGAPRVIPYFFWLICALEILLLSYLQQVSTYCTDNDAVEEDSGPPSGGDHQAPSGDPPRKPFGATDVARISAEEECNLVWPQMLTTLFSRQPSYSMKYPVH